MPSGREQYATGHIPGSVHLDYGEDLSDPETPYATRVAPRDPLSRTRWAPRGSAMTASSSRTMPEPCRSRRGWCGCCATTAIPMRTCLPVGSRRGSRRAARSKPATPLRRRHRHPPPLLPHRPRGSRRARDRSCARRATTCWRSPKGAAASSSSRRNAISPTRSATATFAARYGSAGTFCSKTSTVDGIAPLEKLQGLVRDAGLDPHKRTIVSCGSGVSAAGAWLALREAGFEDVAVYDGSWMEWSHFGLPSVPKSP